MVNNEKDFCRYAARKLAGEVGAAGLSEDRRTTLIVTLNTLSAQLRKLGHSSIADRYDEAGADLAARKRGLRTRLRDLRVAVESALQE